MPVPSWKQHKHEKTVMSSFGLRRGLNFHDFRHPTFVLSFLRLNWRGDRTRTKTSQTFTASFIVIKVSGSRTQLLRWWSSEAVHVSRNYCLQLLMSKDSHQFALSKFGTFVFNFHWKWEFSVSVCCWLLWIVNRTFRQIFPAPFCR